MLYWRLAIRPWRFAVGASRLCRQEIFLLAQTLRRRGTRRQRLLGAALLGLLLATFRDPILFTALILLLPPAQTATRGLHRPFLGKVPGPRAIVTLLGALAALALLWADWWLKHATPDL